MMERNDAVLCWARGMCMGEYAKDVCLLLAYGSCVNGTAHRLSDVDMYYIPANERANGLCRTFVLEGVGYDLFPMSWERVEGLSELKESLLPCLGNASVLYARSAADLARFETLKERLFANLRDQNLRGARIRERFDAARALVGELRAEDLRDARLAGGWALLNMAECVAFQNGAYFSRGLKKMEEDIAGFPEKPDGFLERMREMTLAKTGEDVRACALALLETTGAFLGLDASPIAPQAKQCPEKGVTDGRAMADWYGEVSSTFNKLTVCAERGDAVLAFVTGCCLQETLDELCEENGLVRFDLLSRFDARDLRAFELAAREIERAILAVIRENGGSVRSYDGVDAFLRAEMA